MADQGITDPNILAIMAKLNQAEQSPQETQKEEKKEEFKAPRTFEEFLKAEKMKEWPARITSESMMDLTDERNFLGTQEDILNQLRDATPIDMKFLQDLESRLKALEGRLHYYADKIVFEPQEQTVEPLEQEETPAIEYDPGHKQNFGNRKVSKDPTLALKDKEDSGTKTFLTETTETGLSLSTSRLKVKKKKGFKEKLLESKRKSVEYCKFPGFRRGELTELPHQIEAPQILNRITKAQDFNAGFKKFWKKAFQSEASVAVMQDTFWWIFLDNFERNRQKEADAVFNRIADSFVALFTSINPEIKDKFLAVYPDALAQSVFAVYHEAFPESDRQFDDEFKQKLVHTIYEWVSGIHPPPGTFEHWDIKRLEPKQSKSADEKDGIVKTMLEGGLNKQVDYSLDMDDFHRVVQKLGTEPATQSRSGTAPTIRISVSRDLNNRASHSPVNVTSQSAVSASRLAQCGSPKKLFEQSAQIGSGPELERVLFNLDGQSPLVEHYLRMRQLQEGRRAGRKVRRTELSSKKAQGPTFKQVIKESKLMSETLSKEYQSICEMTSSEISKIERHQRKINKDINKLQKELQFCKNSLEVKILSDRIFDKRENTPRLATNAIDKAQNIVVEQEEELNNETEED